jgi:hypothetical protein
MFSSSLLPIITWSEFMRKNRLMWEGNKLVKIPDKHEPKHRKATGLIACTIKLSKEGGMEILPGGK